MKIQLYYMRAMALKTLFFAVLLLPAIAWSFQYGGGSCEFKIDFPEAPTTKKITTKDGQSFEQAQFLGDNYFLRAECFPFESAAVSAELLTPLVRQFAEKEGLSSTQFSTSKSILGTTVIGRGTKQTAGLPSTYEFRCLMGVRSTACITGAAPSSLFPHVAIERFFQSVVLDKAEKPLYKGWDPIGNGRFINFYSVEPGKTTKGWILQDKKVVSNGVASEKIQYEVDCAKKKFRIASSIGYPQLGGEGAAVFFNSSGSKWFSVPPETVVDKVFFMLCLSQNIHDSRHKSAK